MMQNTDFKLKHVILALVVLLGTTFSIPFFKSGVEAFYFKENLNKDYKVSSEKEKSKLDDNLNIRNINSIELFEDEIKSEIKYSNFVDNILSSFKKDGTGYRKEYRLQKGSFLNSINATSFLVGDLDTGDVIFERAPYKQYPIASITKYITAITSIELLDQDVHIRVSKGDLLIEGNRARFIIGDSIKIKDLLFPLLLVSSNDASEILANYDNRDFFVSHMKSKVEKFGLFNTNFNDPSGLSKENVSTAKDLFKLMRAIRNEHPKVVEISRLREKKLDGYRWTNINKAQFFTEFQGGKTGYTNAAKQTSIGYYKIITANEQERSIAIVILQSSSREKDTSNIINYIKNFVAYL